MERMRVEMFGNSASAREVVPQIDALVLLDRSVDLLTPLSTQLTYEGLIDEVFGIKHCEDSGDSLWVGYCACEPICLSF